MLTDDTAKNFHATSFSYIIYQYPMDISSKLLHIYIQIYDHVLTLHFKINPNWINWVSLL